MGLNLPKQEPVVFAKPKGDERQRITRMRTALVMGSPFWGILATRLKPVERADGGGCGTMGTDAKHLFYNPAYVAGMKDEELKGLLAHEVSHCSFGHMWRKHDRNHRIWNMACDYAIDPILIEAGFKVPNALVNPDWKNWSAEQIYNALLKEAQDRLKQKQKQQRQQQPDDAAEEEQEDEHYQSGSGESSDEEQEGEDAGGGAGNDESDGAGSGAGGQGEGEEGDGDAGSGGDATETSGGKAKGNGSVQGGGGGNPAEALADMLSDVPTKGEVLDPTAESALQDQAEWKQAVASAAAAAKSQGKLPGSLEILIEEALAPKVDWKSALRKFVQMLSSIDYNWSQPSKRYVASGFYLPRLRSESMPPIIIVVDTSGSIGGKELQQFSGEVSSIIEEAKPEAAWLIFADDGIQGKPTEFLPGDPIVFKPKGGGGTSFVHAFKWVEEQGIDPSCLIYLTDMYGTFPHEEPPYPVIWASTTDPKRLGRYEAPFGETLFLDFE